MKLAVTMDLAGVSTHTARRTRVTILAGVAGTGVRHDPLPVKGAYLEAPVWLCPNTHHITRVPTGAVRTATHVRDASAAVAPAAAQY